MQFEHTIPQINRPQNYALRSPVTSIAMYSQYLNKMHSKL